MKKLLSKTLFEKIEVAKLSETDGDKKTRLYRLARKLRRDSTYAEQKIWWHLKNKQLDGARFRRQRVVGCYIVDFICIRKKLVIEVDGGQHNVKEGKEKDGVRDQWLASKGYTVLRFWNNEVLENIEGVLEEIKRHL